MHSIALIFNVFKTFFWEKLIPVGEQVAKNGDDWDGYLCWRGELGLLVSL